METCIRCNATMERGFLLDSNDEKTRWASGAPDTSVFRLSAVGKGEQTLPVVTYRCTSCGRLEWFARS
jgi:hypothetical protein